MISAISKKEIHIRLTDERIGHIVRNRQEMEQCMTWVLETIENPDFILAGDFGELVAIKKYEKTPVTTDKYLTVVYKELNEVDGFVITAYFRRSYNTKRRTIWKA